MPVDEIVAKDEGTGSQRVPEGQYMAVCCDIIDLGMVETTWQGKTKEQHKCAIVFQLDEINPATGQPYEIGERFTVSMNDRARLRKFLGDWRGKAYTDEEAHEGAPLHKLYGVNALVQVEHREGGNGKTYANIGSIMRSPKGSAVRKVTPDYVRAEFWKKTPSNAVRGDIAPLDESGQYEDADLEPLPFNDGGADMNGEFFAAAPPQYLNALREGR